MYEKFKFHRIRLHFETGYPSTAQGQIHCAYNTGLRDEISTDVEYIAAQRGAMFGPVYRGYAISIPKSAFSETPSRRPCRGSDEETYIFDAVWNIQGQNLTGQFSVFIDYDVSFFTPQLQRESQSPYVSVSRSIGGDLQSIATEGIQVSEKQNVITIKLRDIARKIIANVVSEAVFNLGTVPIRIEAFRKGNRVARLEYSTYAGGTTSAKTTIYSEAVTPLTSSVSSTSSDSSSTKLVESSANQLASVPDGAAANSTQNNFTIDAEEIDTITAYFNVESGLGYIAASFIPLTK